MHSECWKFHAKTKKKIVTLQLKFLYYFVQSRHLEKLTFMEFQHSMCFTFRGTYS